LFVKKLYVFLIKFLKKNKGEAENRLE